MIVELLNVRRNRIFAVPYHDGFAGTPYAVPSGCVVEPLHPGRRKNGMPTELPATLALDGRGRAATPETPALEVSLLPLTGLYRMPSGEAAAVYGAVPKPIN